LRNFIYEEKWREGGKNKKSFAIFQGLLSRKEEIKGSELRLLVNSFSLIFFFSSKITIIFTLEVIKKQEKENNLFLCWLLIS
jgi:16S rRNA C1402 (ribose-2'-O) methylase RsmI